MTPAGAGATTAPPLLTGTVGPGFTITLKKGGVKVRRLKAGRYRIRVTDRSDVHDFWIKGPIKRNVTGVGFEGTKTVTLRLPKGSYTYYCAIHPPMKAAFRAT
jgi:plastocyanin